VNDLFVEWQCNNCGKQNHKHKESCCWCSNAHPLKKKIAEKDKTIEKLEYYKNQWQEIGGKANLRNLKRLADESAEKDKTIEKLKESNKWLIEFLEQFKDKPPYVLHQELDFIISEIKDLETKGERSE